MKALAVSIVCVLFLVLGSPGGTAQQTLVTTHAANEGRIDIVFKSQAILSFTYQTLEKSLSKVAADFLNQSQPAIKSYSYVAAGKERVLVVDFREVVAVNVDEK